VKEKQMSTPMPMVNGAEDLDGVALGDGWTIVSRIPDRPGATGGHFSIAYTARHEDGREGFCKVLNYLMAATSGDPASAMQGMVEAYNFERDLLRQCGDERLSRVVLSVGEGQFQRPGYALPTVSYLIFEVAEGDVRKILDSNPAVTFATKMRWLHHTATGLRQLHERGVAHQDVKPSNVLVFASDDRDELPGKIGDLGRATDPRRPMWHDALPIAGDMTYAPPEQLYRATPTEFGPRRLACDLYQLGSVAAFLIGASPLNALLTLELHPQHHWSNWRGTYAEVLPYVRDAFGRACARVDWAMRDHDIAPRAGALIRDLCDPDPMQRGHHVTRSRPGDPYALERVVAEFDLLARKARLNALRQAA
jgi:serine/threonine protein kinase